MEHQVKAYAFIAPSLLILTVFVFIPLAGAIGISLMNIDIYMKNISFAGIANYIKMFQDERVANATFHTFYFALLEVPLQMIVALLLLMFMLRNTKLHKLLRTVFYLPYVCSMTAVSIMCRCCSIRTTECCHICLEKSVSRCQTCSQVRHGRCLR